MKQNIKKMVYGYGLSPTYEELKKDLKTIQPSQEVGISIKQNSLIVDLIR